MRKIIILFFVSLSLMVFAQPNTATQLLENAKNGALLFRLTTKAKQIEVLNSAGRQTEAKQLAKEMRLDQEAWINAFSANYNYGKVYYFYDYDARKIVDRDLSVVFDAEFNLLNNTDFNFLVAGVSETKNFSLDGLILLTPQMEDVPKGMPRFISAYGFLHLKKKTYFKIVEELNKALSNY